MKSSLLTIVLLLLPTVVLSESYLCTAEAGGGVRDRYSEGKYEGSEYDVRGNAWILKNVDNKWLVDKAGAPGSRYFANCLKNEYSGSAIMCESLMQTETFTFLSNPKSYYIVHMTVSEKNQWIDRYIEAGDCVEI